YPPPRCPKMLSQSRGFFKVLVTTSRGEFGLSVLERGQLLIDPLLRRPALQLVPLAQVDEARVARQPRVDLLDPTEHLLSNPPVVRVALRGRPELTQVVDLPEVGTEVPAHVEGQGHDVLGQRTPEVALELAVRRGRGLDRPFEVARHAELGQAGRAVKAQRGAEELSVLGQHAMAMKVPIGREV